MTALTGLTAIELAELAPLIRRAADLDPAIVARLRVTTDSATAFVQLPFGVLAGRRIAGSFATVLDGSFGCAELLGWLDRGESGDSDKDSATAPLARDAQWRAGLPPEAGWRRIETVPDDVIRSLVRQGALTLKEAAEGAGMPGAEPRAEVTNALLDSVVLTATDRNDQTRQQVEVSLRLLSGLVRMGFLRRDSTAGIDTVGRWLRVSAAYGSVYAERGGLGLGLTAQPHRRVGWQ